MRSGITGERQDIMKEVIHEMFSEEQVQNKIVEIAEKLNNEYAGQSLHLICILKGSIFFFTELAKHLTIPVTMDFMVVSSYGNGTSSSGNLEIRKDLEEPIEGLHCLIVEDIIDSGNTLSLTRKMLQGRGPASLKICTLLDKPERRETQVEVEYTGFVIPDAFVVGYGLDYAQKYRNLPYIGVLEFVEE